MPDILVIRSPNFNSAGLPLPKEKNIGIVVVYSKNSERVEVNSTKKIILKIYFRKVKSIQN
jgi:hypothetical protein